MDERVEHFRAVEAALYEATGYQEACTRAHVAEALAAVDPELTEKQVGETDTHPPIANFTMRIRGQFTDMVV